MYKVFLSLTAIKFSSTAIVYGSVWPHNVIERGIRYLNVCPSVRPSNLWITSITVQDIDICFAVAPHHRAMSVVKAKFCNPEFRVSTRTSALKRWPLVDSENFTNHTQHLENGTGYKKKKKRRESESCTRPLSPLWKIPRPAHAISPTSHTHTRTILRAKGQLMASRWSQIRCW